MVKSSWFVEEEEGGGPDVRIKAGPKVANELHSHSRHRELS